MIKAILLDLDDTLLGNPTEQFVTRYLALLGGFLGERLGIEPAIARALVAAVQAIVRSDDPRRTNWETFYGAFDPLLAETGVTRVAFDPVVKEFYRDVYPQLQPLTQRRPGARLLVEWLLARDYRVAVATNPFFPRTAIEQRLAWAGVPVDAVEFAIVTTLDNMHYAKPHPAYYEEVLARVGVQADEAIMVGDDWKNDIVPAWHAGLNTFWVCQDCAVSDDQSVLPDGSGSLADFACRVQDENWLEMLEPLPRTIPQIAPRMNGNLAALLGIVHEAPDHVWSLRPDEEEWTPMEVLCHMHESETELQRPRFEIIAREENPFLSQPKEPPAPASRVCPENALLVAAAFAKERARTVEYLTALTPEQWARPARHYIFGPTTMLEMAHFTAQHDRLHITQLCQTIGKCM
ncbi:MAG: HAD hydrolase-like protein [Anaerolineae bacterium]|nr:HAD hydrolase-like protein [Anaerolineae bacterium]